MAIKPAASWDGSLNIRQGNGRITRAWSQVASSRAAAAKPTEGFAPAVLEADLEVLYDLALANIVGPSLEQAEVDFRTGQTFTLDEWLEDSDEDA